MNQPLHMPVLQVRVFQLTSNCKAEDEESESWRRQVGNQLEIQKSCGGEVVAGVFIVYIAITWLKTAQKSV